MLNKKDIRKLLEIIQSQEMAEGRQGFGYSSVPEIAQLQTKLSMMLPLLPEEGNQDEVEPSND